MRITASFLLLCFCLCDITNSAPAAPLQNVSKQNKYNLVLHLNSGHVLNEEVKINVAEGTEYFRVPKHGDKEEIEVMQDFTKKLTIIQKKSENICYISKLELETPPNELKTIIESKIPVIRNLELIEVTSWRIDKVHTQRSLLSEDAAVMCAGRSIYWIENMNRNASRQPRGNDHFRVRRSCTKNRVCWYEYQYKLAKSNGKIVVKKIAIKKCRKIYC